MFEFRRVMKRYKDATSNTSAAEEAKGEIGNSFYNFYSTTQPFNRNIFSCDENTLVGETQNVCKKGFYASFAR